MKQPWSRNLVLKRMQLDAVPYCLRQGIAKASNPVFVIFFVRKHTPIVLATTLPRMMSIVDGSYMCHMSALQETLFFLCIKPEVDVCSIPTKGAPEARREHVAKYSVDRGKTLQIATPAHLQGRLHYCSGFEAEIGPLAQLLSCMCSPGRSASRRALEFRRAARPSWRSCGAARLYWRRNVSCDCLARAGAGGGWALLRAREMW